MQAEDPFDDLDFRTHKVPRSDFDQLAHGQATPRVVRGIRQAEHSRRLLLLRPVDEKLKKQPDLMGPLPHPDRAWEPLDRVEQVSRRTLDLVLAHPYTGAWAGYTTRLLRNRITGVCPLWVHVGHLHALAAAAGIRAGLSFETRIPVWDGGAMLPTLGMARLATEAPHSTAMVRAHADNVEVSDQRTTVRLPRDPAADGPNWWGLRRMSARAGGLDIAACLDDLDPYRGLYAPAGPQRPNGKEMSTWRTMLAEAWQQPVQCLPDLATGFLTGFDSLVPRPEVPFRSLSGSTEEASGSAVVARPVDATELAATLVHEFHHILLSGLLHLVPMYRRDSRERFLTLWRDDPRPIGGVVQGVYAFFGVTAFWRALTHHGKGNTKYRAEFEFDYWRARTWHTLPRCRRPTLPRPHRPFNGPR